jgi:hypothetical protein
MKKSLRKCGHKSGVYFSLPLQFHSIFFATVEIPKYMFHYRWNSTIYFSLPLQFHSIFFATVEIPQYIFHYRCNCIVYFSLPLKFYSIFFTAVEIPPYICRHQSDKCAQVARQNGQCPAIFTLLHHSLELVPQITSCIRSQNLHRS